LLVLTRTSLCSGLRPGLRPPILRSRRRLTRTSLCSGLCPGLRPSVFGILPRLKTSAFNRSATSPDGRKGMCFPGIAPGQQACKVTELCAVSPAPGGAQHATKRWSAGCLQPRTGVSSAELAQSRVVKHGDVETTEFSNNE